MNITNTTSEAVTVAAIALLFSERVLLPAWKEWLQHRTAASTITQPQSSDSATINQNEAPSGESARMVLLDAIIGIFVLWRLAALSLSDAPVTVGALVQVVTLGAALVISTQRKR